MSVGSPHSVLTLAQLAQASGCPPRTIRYYIARGLVPPPRKAGPAAHYGEEHLQRLRQIQTWQAEGLTLAEIGQRLEGDDSPARPALERTAWWSYAVAPEVMVQVRADTSPWRARHIQRALQELAERLATPPNEKDSPDANDT